VVSWGVVALRPRYPGVYSVSGAIDGSGNQRLCAVKPRRPFALTAATLAALAGSNSGTSSGLARLVLSRVLEQ
jgi:hypothetical protein